jgi:hypothetical protein
MKYSILEALKVIETMFPLINLDKMIGIEYENFLNNQFKFYLQFGLHKMLVDLDNETYQLVE